MPLTKTQAKRLNEVITRAQITQASTQQAKNEWNENMSGEPVWHQKTTHEDLQRELIACRTGSLDRKSVLVDVDGIQVRVFPQSPKNIDNDVNDIFARGIDS
ncbi:hypothetical protein, partial [Legionella tunisiensis]|uniref:hypothetical protein n=1 Tax=Legionella tunisiensis TaxID=1034944 RepID=UPI0005944167